MSSVVAHLAERELIRPPKWMPSNVHLEVIMGSVAYSVSDDSSDFDVYGFAIPPKHVVFPHLAGEVPGFGRQVQRFDQFQAHYVQDADALGGKGRNYDLSIYSIVRFFHLAMENNPNMVDALFVPTNCVLFSTTIGQIVRENRRAFLHKGSWHKFKGYAYSQLHKMGGNRERVEGKRRAMVEEHGYDLKFAYHVVRLLDEVEQILSLGDLELGRNREQLKAIRRGEWTEERVRQHFADNERRLEDLYAASTLPYGPDEDALKRLLLSCLEQHYGSLADACASGDPPDVALREIEAVIAKVRGAR